MPQAAFAEFRKRGTGEHDWAGWADLFTDDATYVEHNLGTMRGRQQIKDFIVGCMGEYGAMSFDIEWSMIDGDRVVFYIWNLLPDPTGGGTEYKFPNTTVLQYGGGGKWKFEEDFYNPASATEVSMIRLKYADVNEVAGLLGAANLADRVTLEAYSHEVSSCGFWPGGDGIETPAFYSYSYPEPPGFPEAPVRPNGAFYSKELGQFILPYDIVRQADAPDETLLEFLQSTYEAAATLARWDRSALERSPAA